MQGLEIVRNLTLSFEFSPPKTEESADAHRALAQFFFDNDVFYRFPDECQKVDIKA